MLSRLSAIHWLFLILIITALQWYGGAYVGLSTDDYHYLHHLAPIDDVSDIPDAFRKSDANPQYWRPVSNATLTADFLLYGWKGGGYHVTNLLLHLLATALVFLACKKLFQLDDQINLFATAMFGLSAGHDSNLLWIAARGDILVTIFSLSTLLLVVSQQVAYRLLALIAFFLALSSKELAVVVLPLIAVVTYSQSESATTKRRLLHVLLTVLPFVAVTVVYLILRASFTSPEAVAQPMTGEGMRSMAAAIKNLIYGIAYLLAPIDLSSAVTILTTYKTEAFVVAAIFSALVALLLWKTRRHFEISELILPLLFALCFAVTVAQSFERWRLYAPSIGLYAIIAIIAAHVWRSSSKSIKVTMLVVSIAIAGFHIFRAAEEKESWRLASEILENVKQDYKRLIAKHGDTPLFLITQPSKIGGGSIMKVSSAHIVLQAKAEVLKPSDISRASLGGVTASHDHSLLVLALDPDKGFASINVQQLSENTFRVTVPQGSATRIQPEQNLVGSVARENRLTSGDTLATAEGKVVVHKAERAYATDVTLITDLKSRIPIYFDGTSLQELKTRH